MGCSYYGSLKRNINADIENINNRIYDSKQNLENINDSIKNKKDNILKKINDGNNFKIIDELKEYYNLLDEKSKLNDRLIFLQKRKKDLNDLLNKIDGDIEENKYIICNEQDERIKREYKGINPNYNSLIDRGNQKDQYSDNIKNIENLYGLHKQILKEINGIDDRKKSFKKKLDEKKDSSFTYPSTLKKSINNYLNEYENSLNNFKEDLNTYHNNIKRRIKNILEEEIDELDELDELEIFVNKEKIDYLISNQNKLEEEILKNKNKDIENAKNEELIKLRKEEISSEMSDLKNLINKIVESKKSLDNRIIECNNLNQLIDQKEKKHYFISLQIKDKIEKMKDLEKYRKNLNMLINSLNEQISIFFKIVFIIIPMINPIIYMIIYIMEE